MLAVAIIILVVSALISKLCLPGQVSIKDTFARQTIVITGASSGIGAAVARQLAACPGVRLVLASRAAGALSKVAKDCTAAGCGDVLCIPTDVTDRDSCFQLIAKTVKLYGGIDTLILSAGVSMAGGARDISNLDVFQRLIEVNYLGSVYVTQYTLPHLTPRARIGVISSLSGKFGVPFRTAYCGSKFALHGYFEALRQEEGGGGGDALSITMVCPGYVDTALGVNRLGPDGRANPPATHKPAKMMTADQCAQHSLQAIAQRRREDVFSWSNQLGLLLKVLAPSVIDSIVYRKST